MIKDIVEIVPQHTFHYGDGVPAYKSGEWYGSRPNHFIGSKLILRPIEKPSKFFLAHSIHFPPKYSEEYKFRPCIRKLYPFPHDGSYRPSKKVDFPPHIQIPTHFHNRGKVPPDQMGSSFVAPLFQKKMRVNILNLKKNKSLGGEEFNVESQMFRKKRVASLEDQRNKYRKVNPGDKNYKYVDCSPDFYKEEGLIPGSTNKLNLNKTMRKGEDNFYQTLDLRIKVLDDTKLWKRKIFRESLDKDKKYVLNLGKWDENNVVEHNKKDKDNNENENDKEDILNELMKKTEEE